MDSPSKLTIKTGEEKEKKENQYKASDYLDSTDPSLGETLVDDIESFLQKAKTNNRIEHNNEDVSSNFTECLQLILNASLCIKAYGKTLI